MKVKVCGLRRIADAELAIALGASHVGIVLAEDSPRRATLAEAQAIVAAARAAGVTSVLVFRGEPVDTIHAQARQLGVHRVQCHGLREPQLSALRAHGLAPLPVLQIATDAKVLPKFTTALDASTPGVLDGGRGGAGVTFSWSLLGDRSPEHVLIAGGIAPDNVGQLLRHHPWGIDTSSGIERAPGHKDHARMRDLFAQIERIENSPTDTGAMR